MGFGKFQIMLDFAKGCCLQGWLLPTLLLRITSRDRFKWLPVDV